MPTGPYSLLQQHIRETDPRAILRDLLPETILPPDLDDMTLWQIIINISEPPKRKKRKDINTLEDVVRLLHESKRILVLTGAGVCANLFHVTVSLLLEFVLIDFYLNLFHCHYLNHSLFFLFCAGLCFLWDTRFPFQRWYLCTACCRLS